MTALAAALLFQATVTPPEGDAYKWISGIAVAALVALLWRYDASRDKVITDCKTTVSEWRTAAGEAADETKLNTATMAKQTDALNAVGASNLRLVDAVNKLEARMERVEQKVVDELSRRER